QGWTYVSKSGQVVRGAHLAGTEITSLAFSQDGHTLLSRSLDSSLKVWDLRNHHQHPKVPLVGHPETQPEAIYAVSEDEEEKEDD
ncbi:WD_REPEATS_REGION domain-containing protein, partial [Haematococcus lacustris]